MMNNQHARTGNEIVPKNIINTGNTIILFFKLRRLVILLFVYFILEIYLYFSIVNDQRMEPALCQLYRATGPASMSVRLCDCLCPKITIALQTYHSPPRLSQFTGNLLGLDSTRSKIIGTDSAFRLPCNDCHSCLDTHT